MLAGGMALPLKLSNLRERIGIMARSNCRGEYSVSAANVELLLNGLKAASA